MKLYYNVKSEDYERCLQKIKEKFSMHMEVDEARTTLRTEDQSRIERVIGTFDSNTDEAAQVRVVLEDESLKEFFDSVLGEPYRVR
jgi:hypothetical protein